MSARRVWRQASAALLAALLAACASAPPPAPEQPAQAWPGLTPPNQEPPGGPALLRGKSRWTPVSWASLPGFESDALADAWNAWLKSCERPGRVFAPLCSEVRQLSIGDEADKRQWMQAKLQPYRIEALSSGASDGLLTAYFEPELEARRQPGQGFEVPLYQPPATLAARKPWFSRQEIDTVPAAQAALRGRAIAYVSDPVDALVLQIQGSGRVRLTEPDGTRRLVRLAYAGNNGHPYQSVGRWLLDQGALRDASWPGIRAWMQQHPQDVPALLWRNPRVVFFKEEPLSDFDAGFGPRGAQGVPLTPGRSIAVDPDSIPFGTPVWLASDGASARLQRLVLAQDTGSAIVGAVRADYFAGWGAPAGELAGRLKQGLQLWALWPKAVP